MPLIVRNLTLGIDEPEENLVRPLSRALHVPPRAIRSYSITHRAIDARRHFEIRRVYHVECAVDADEQKLIQRGRLGQIALLEHHPIPHVDAGLQKLDHPPVIIGTGPAGLFAGLLLAERGYQPVILERGQDVPARHKALHLYYTQSQFDPENNLLFGIGGAGTYSDGKLYSRTHDPRNQFVLETLVRFGANPDILIDAKPHVGSDRLPGICRRMVDHIRDAGGQVRYGARVVDFEVAQDSGLTALCLADGGRILTSACILATGHSARDIYRTLAARGVTLSAKPFQMGVRIEHPQSLINANQFGQCAAVLGPADYMLVAKRAAGQLSRCGPDLFTFCMCPGGTILPSNESPGEICTNGASTSFRNTPFANSGLVITILPEEFGNDPLAGLEYQRQWEQLAYRASNSYAVPAQRAADYLANRVSQESIACSFPIGAHSADLRSLLPGLLIEALDRGLPMLDRMIPGYASAEGVLTAPETRASSPIRIPRDELTRQSVSTAGLYPVGEGAGYAGGIVSSAVDGLKTAEAMIRQYAPI